MLIPNRFENLRISLMNISALTIEFLLNKEGYKATVREISTHLNQTSKELDKEDVVHIVTFLFALGKASYTVSDDTVRLIL